MDLAPQDGSAAKEIAAISGTGSGAVRGHPQRLFDRAGNQMGTHNAVVRKGKTTAETPDRLRQHVAVIGTAWLWREGDGHATDRMRVALLLPYGAALLLLAALVASSEPPTDGAFASLTPPLPSVLACVVVAVGVSCLLRRFGWIHLVALTVTVPAALWVRDPTRAQLHLPALMLEVLVLFGFGISLRRVPAAVAGTFLTIAFTGLAALRAPARDWAWCDMAVINCGVLAACAAFMATLISTARETDQLAAEADALETQTRLESTRSSVAHRARGLAHNNAVYALEAISSGQPRAECTALATQVIRTIGRSDEKVQVASTTQDLVRELEKLSPVRLLVTTDAGDVPPSAVPPEVHDAICEAAGEALRNVRKHAGVEQARLSIRTSGRSLDVTITDQGLGVSPNARTSYGVRETIVGALQAVGGTARLVSWKGGTEVRLHWSATSDPRPEPREGVTSAYYASVDVGDGGRLFGRVGWPLLVVQTYLAIRHSLGSQHQLLLLILLMVLVGATALTILRLNRGPLQASEVMGIGLFAAAVAAVGFAGVGIASARNFESWFIGFAAVPLILVAFTTTWRGLILLALPSAVLTPALIAVSPAVSLIQTAGCWLTPAGVIVSWVVGVLIRQSRAGASAERTRVVEARVAAARHEANVWASNLHLGFARSAVLPFLVAVESGQLDPTAAPTRIRASTLAAHARDELIAPGLLDAAIRERLAQFRERGGTVTLQHPGEAAVDTRLVVRLLDRALDVVADDAAVTVTTADGDGWSRLSITPPPADLGRIERGLDGVPHDVRRYPGLVQFWFRSSTPPAGNRVEAEMTVESPYA